MSRVLLDTWQAAITGLHARGEGLSQEQWQAATPCPGWSVADVVAHVVDVEQFLGGYPRPSHDPDWTALPLVQTDFGRFTEVGVDYRRSHSRTSVLDELSEVIVRRRAQLEAVPEGGEVMGVFGKPMALDALLRMRTFDIWIHEWDICTAIGADIDMTSAPARIAFEQVAGALPVVWAKRIGAAPGSIAVIDVDDAGGVESLAVRVDDAGRGAGCDPVPDPTVRLRMTRADYLARSCGRVPADDAELLSRVRSDGDPVLAERLLAELAITP